MKYSRAKTKKCRKKTSDLDLVLVHTRENSPFAKLMSVGSFSNDDGDGNGNENVKKAIVLLSKTTSLHVHHAFLYIVWPLPHVCEVKMPSFTFYGGRKQVTTNFSSSF